ncbi:Serine/threonine-protein kinase BRI1-like 1 [Geodia barretti]|uniref:Serine/threonine-protein kinase BRI1-like 1 n=1 Tax=Geodia barretti TaxID=519541 RepID=A0AA35XKN5_GEOBA|nr:Serine/threonine-protein kinase BRI1-like 1 [Geodia barretti]
MEKLATSLHDILDPQPPPRNKPFVPVSLKLSVLHDVARGLSFLHSHSPPIIHRDLSARNVLLNEGMVAKIADLGMARILPSLRASTMTKAPGASIYMPPEALEDESRYDITIDIFSLGVLAIFTLSQMFPKPLAPTYMDRSRRIVGRTELERRGNYMQEVMRQFREGHSLVQMIQRCLNNIIEERPTIQQVMGLLEDARAEVEDGEYDVNKLSLAQLLQSRNLSIQQQRIQIDQQQQQIRQNGQEICSLRSKMKH